MRVEILGDERRRRWSHESKLEVVLSPPSTTVFLPLDTPPAGDRKEARAFDGMQVLPPTIELEMRCGRSLRFSGDVDVVALKRLIPAIEVIAACRVSG
ncbi:hypothetical protein KHC17_24065 (plasmid) [Agrobacterium salinitolerans]|uniref:hypothetical protein n=1 Tax=Agrobacterium salinitolerans TaxID=1183413 RepID=UPI001C2233DB|nr:hypothetical protein [Agrobacterium salinitolerans]QXC52258.1 hypothetical protein KHC17_24065 [Agrobacterium salinitolerans]